MNRGNADLARPPIVFWALLWVPGLLAFAALIAIDFFSTPGRDVVGRDFVNLWVAGKLVLAGRIDDIFNVPTYQQAVAEYIGLSLPLNYSYPPHALFIAVPFALFPYHVALVLFSVLGAALFLIAARPYLPFPATYAILTPAALLCLWFGHYGLLLGALWLTFFRLFGSRQAGLAAAAMTFKPHMGLLVALAALRSRRTLLWATGAAAVLILASLALFGVGPWFSFLRDTTGAQTELLVNGTDGVFYLRMMPSAYVAYGRGPLAIGLHAAISIAALWIVARSRLDPFAYATATFLILPYAFNYDMTVVSLGFAILLYRDWQRLTLAERAVLAGAFLTPLLTFFLDMFVPPLLLGGLWIQTRHVPSVERDALPAEG